MGKFGSNLYSKPELKVHGKVQEFTRGGMESGSDIDDGNRG